MVSKAILAHGFHEMRALGWAFYCFSSFLLPRSCAPSLGSKMEGGYSALSFGKGLISCKPVPSTRRSCHAGWWLAAMLEVARDHLSSPLKMFEQWVSFYLPAAQTLTVFVGHHTSSKKDPTAWACPTLDVWANRRAVGVRGGDWTGGCHGRVAKGHPMAPQLRPHHVEVSLGVCLAKPEERRWNLFPIHNKRRVKPAGISCTLSVMTNYSRCWCIC